MGNLIRVVLVDNGENILIIRESEAERKHESCLCARGEIDHKDLEEYDRLYKEARILLDEADSLIDKVVLDFID